VCPYSFPAADKMARGGSSFLILIHSCNSSGKVCRFAFVCMPIAVRVLRGRPLSPRCRAAPPFGVHSVRGAGGCSPFTPTGKLDIIDIRVARNAPIGARAWNLK
jgi:hypothetical protein